MTEVMEERFVSANEAASVTGVPLKQVHRIIDAGLLGEAVKSKKGVRVVLSDALVGLKLAHETTGILTLEGRRRLVGRLLDDPKAATVREAPISVDMRSMKNDVRRGLTTLEKAKEMIVSDKEVLGGAPCFKGTRVPAHDVAEMIANGDESPTILAAYPSLTQKQIKAAMVYSEAYPRRGRPRREAAWQKKMARSSSEMAFDELPEAS